MLSMLRYFLRKQGMRDLGLPAALPIAVLLVLASGECCALADSSRTRVGLRYLKWWGERARREVLCRYFGDAVHNVGELRL